MDEPEDEPPKKVAEELEKRGIAQDKFIVFNIGETKNFAPNVAVDSSKLEENPKVLQL